MSKLPKVEATWEQHYQRMLDKGEYKFGLYHILESKNEDGSFIIYETPQKVGWQKYHYKSVRIEDVVCTAFPPVSEISEAAWELDANNGDSLGVVFYKQHTAHGEELKCFLAGFPDEDDSKYSNIVTQRNIPNATHEELTTRQFEVLVRYLKAEFKRNKKYADEGAR